MSEDPISRNRPYWDRSSDEYQERHGGALGEQPEAWGVFRIPEAELRVLGEIRGLDALELGCGAAQWSIALHRRGARAVGLDLSQRQLAHARRLVAEAGIELPLVLGSAERLPFDDASFDLVLSDHGATTFSRPELAITEAARVLRSGGVFVFCGASPLLDIAWNNETREIDDRLHANYFDLYRLDDEEASATYYQLSYGNWVRLFRDSGLLIDDLIEIRPPAGAETTYADYVDLDWARRWPAENLWRLRKI